MSEKFVNSVTKCYVSEVKRPKGTQTLNKCANCLVLSAAWALSCIVWLHSPHPHYKHRLVRYYGRWPSDVTWVIIVVITTVTVVFIIFCCYGRCYHFLSQSPFLLRDKTCALFRRRWSEDVKNYEATIMDERYSGVPYTRYSLIKWKSHETGFSLVQYTDTRDGIKRYSRSVRDTTSTNY